MSVLKQDCLREQTVAMFYLFIYLQVKMVVFKV